MLKFCKSKNVFFFIINIFWVSSNQIGRAVRLAAEIRHATLTRKNLAGYPWPRDPVTSRTETYVLTTRSECFFFKFLKDFRYSKYVTFFSKYTVLTLIDKFSTKFYFPLKLIITWSYSTFRFPHWSRSFIPVKLHNGSIPRMTSGKFFQAKYLRTVLVSILKRYLAKFC